MALRKIVVPLFVAVLAAGVVTAVVAAELSGDGNGEKPTSEEREAQQKAMNPPAPPAPKPPVLETPGPSPDSCPQAGIVEDRVWSDLPFPLPSSSALDDITLVNLATAAGSNGYNYSIFGGYLSKDQDQGVIVTWGAPADPCAQPSLPAQGLAEYPTPFRSGKITLTKVDGDSVIFARSDGTTGTFEYTTGKFQ